MAIKMYTDAIRLAPGQHTLYSNRSACQCAAGDYESALSDAGKCIDLMPAWPKGYVRKGAALHGLDRWSEAIVAYEAGLKFDPTAEALRQGIDDANRRRALAGGDWQFIGKRKVHGDRGLDDLLKVPRALCAVPGVGLCVLDSGKDGYDVVHVLNHDASRVRCTLNADQQINRTGLFGHPKSVASDGGHVFVTDQMKCRVIKCSATTGELVAAAGRSSGVPEGFDNPHGLALSEPAQGSADAPILFVSDHKNHRIVALDASSLSFRFAFGRWGFGDGELLEPLDIAVHGEHLLVADSGNRRLCLFTLTGDFVRALGPEGPGSQFAHTPHHVALADGAAFCIETQSGRKMDEDKAPGCVHVICPTSGAKLRPPFQPPFATSREGHGALHGLAVFRDALWVSSSFSLLMALPREPASRGGGGRRDAEPESTDRGPCVSLT